MIAALAAAAVLTVLAGYSRSRGQLLVPYRLLWGAAGLLLGGLATWAELALK